MARRADEQLVLERFTQFLNQTTGRNWHASREEIPNPRNGKSYDCEFWSDGAAPIAAEISRLYPLGSYQEAQGARQNLIRKLTVELRAQGVGGWRVETPIPRKKHCNPAWFKSAARQFREAIEQNPGASLIEVDGFKAQPVGDAADPLYFQHHWHSAHQPIEAAGYSLVEILRNKNDQLDVQDHDHCLIVLSRGMPAEPQDVAAACAFIDFRQFPTIDRIYFEVVEGDFRLVYDREAHEAMEAGKLPADDERRRLVVQWIEERMSAHWPSALDLALRISWDERSTEWLSASGRKLLEIEAHLLLQECGWGTPKAVWELHRGPVAAIRDGRRRIQPIR